MKIMINEYIYNKNLESKLLAGFYLISTPIGNMDDITLRALQTMVKLDVLYAENPAQSCRILNHFGFKRSINTYNDHSNINLRQKIIAALKDGKTVGLISDAGTPTISDPGYKLVKYIQEHKLPIYAVPGACAAIAALSCSGLPTDNFHFFGFPPRTEVAAVNYLNNLKKYQGSLIFYETARRINKFISYVQQVFPDAQAFVARELTKLHEEKFCGSIADIDDMLQQKKILKGEFVIVIYNNSQDKDMTFKNDLATVVKIGRKYLSSKDLSKFLSEISNINKNEIYELGIKK